MKKIILISTGVIIAAVITFIVIGAMNLGPLIKTATETYGPKITKTEVRLKDVGISIFSGSVKLEDFYLGNPKGFTMPSALECDTISVKLVTDSLTTDTIIIEEIYVDGPVISYEKRGGTDNFKTIVNNIKRTVAGEKKETASKGEASSETGAEKNIQINNFIVKNGTINLGGSLLNTFGDSGVGMALPDIHLKDIGKEKKTSPAEAFAVILGSMTKNIGNTVVEIGKTLTEGLGKAVEGGTESIGNAVKGLFGD